MELADDALGQSGHGAPNVLHLDHDRTSAAMNAPLSDVRIVAVEQYGAGPFGSVQLADLGAEVIKIEDPATAGDV